MSQDLLEQKELWNVGAGATTTTIPMVTQSGLSVALSAASQAQLAGSTFDCAIGATRCMAVVNSVSASGVLTLDSPLPSVPAQGTQFVLTPTREMSLAGSNLTYGVYDQTSSVPATTGAETINVYATNGTLAKINEVGALIVAPSGATSGSHRLVIAYHDTNDYSKLIDITAAYNVNIIVRRGYVMTGTTTLPSDAASEVALLKDLVISPTIPLVFWYTNVTNVAQTSQRYYRVAKVETGGLF